MISAFLHWRSQMLHANAVERMRAAEAEAHDTYIRAQMPKTNVVEYKIATWRFKRHLTRGRQLK